MALSDEQIDAVTLSQWGEMKGGPLAAHRAYARAIEAEVRGQDDALSMTMAELHDDVELVIRAARKPIEDGVLHALYADVMTGHYADGLHYWRGTPAHRFARAIEQAHGITAAQKGGQHAD